MKASKMGTRLTELGWTWSMEQPEDSSRFRVCGASREHSLRAEGKTPKRALRKALLAAALCEIVDRDERIRLAERRLVTERRGINLTPKEEA